MHYHCPTCAASLEKRSLLLNAVTTCNSCGEQSCLGSFSQYLSASLLALFVGGLSGFFSSAPGSILSAAIAISAALAVLLVEILVFMKPVPYRKSKWIEKFSR